MMPRVPLSACVHCCSVRSKASAGPLAQVQLKSHLVEADKRQDVRQSLLRVLLQRGVQVSRVLPEHLSTSYWSQHRPAIC